MKCVMAMKVAIAVIALLVVVALVSQYAHRPAIAIACGPERDLLVEIREWIETSTDNTDYPRRIDDVMRGAK